MANPGISKAEAKKFVELVEQKLREGYPPMGTTVQGLNGALAETTNELNMPRSSGASKIQSAERAFRKIDWDQY